MIRMMTAYTTEVDEIEDAIKELFGQLNLNELLKHSVGIVYCHYDYIESGVVCALNDHLPFDVLGMTTLSAANNDYSGDYGLVLSVLTSDEIEFSAAYTQPLSEDDYGENINAAYQEALGKLPGNPSFIISFFPYIQNVSGANLVGAFDKACGGIPIWGSVCFGTDFGYENSRTILNGQIERNAVAMLLVHGPIEPQFNTIALPERNIRGNRVIVTDSEGCVLREVNDTPILEYLESIGYTVHKGAPLMVYYPGSLWPVAMAIYTINEDKSVICGGMIPKGASIAIGVIERDGIIETAKERIGQIAESGGKNGAFLFSCIARYFVLSPKQDEEMQIVKGALSDKMPYTLGYSGGEICPVLSEDGSLHNRFHSFTICSCVF